MTTLDLTALEQLRDAGSVRLVRGHHDIANTGEGCAMDLLAWQTTGEDTDMPGCVHPILARTVHMLNDTAASEADRWRLVLDAGPTLVGSDRWPVERVLWVLARGRRSLGDFVAALRASADLRDVNLRDVNLRGANLAGADLRGANLYGAYLRGANLRYADLRGADLRDAELSDADLRYAELSDADLRCVKLSGADLYGADLRGAALSDADLRGANLRAADLSGASLSRADLRCASMSGANLVGANLVGARWDHHSPPPAGWIAVAERLTECKENP